MGVAHAGDARGVVRVTRLVRDLLAGPDDVGPGPVCSGGRRAGVAGPRASRPACIGPRDVSPGGEQADAAYAVCLPGHLRPSAFGGGEARAPTDGAGVAGVRGRGQPGGVAIVAGTGPARGGGQRLGSGPLGEQKAVPAAGMDAFGGLWTASRGARAGGERHHHTHPRLVAPRPRPAAQDPGARRRRRAHADAAWRTLVVLGGGRARGRGPDRGGMAAVDVGAGRPGFNPGPVGGSGSLPLVAGHGALAQDGERGGRRRRCWRTGWPRSSGSRRN